MWTITPQKAAALQNRRGSSARATNISFDDRDQLEDEVNESAKRTLLRLGQKLRGVEKGTPLSVNGQVNLLIQQAMDPTNLCRMYQGWRPHV
jgi:serine-protein kinase ATM